MSIRAELDAIRERVEQASDGPWFAEERNLDEPYSTTTVYNTFHNGDTPDRDLVAEAAYDNAEFIAHARTDLPRLLHVLEEVLEVHRPTDMFEEQVCAECLEYDPSCPSGPAPWPCFTVRTITRALEGE